MNNPIPYNILIVGPAWIGDMVMAQGLFKLIKQNNPDASIDVIAPAWSIALTEFMPEIRRGIPLQIQHGQLALKQRFIIAKQLRGENYQQAIVLPNSFKSALIPFLAKIPKRTGWLGEMRYGLLNDYRILDKQQLPKMIQRFWALALDKNSNIASDAPMPKLAINKEKVKQTLQQFGLSVDKTILALCPGAEYGSSKRWPIEYFAEVANKKIQQGHQVWLFGSNSDQAIAEKIKQASDNKAVNLAGKTTLSEAINLLSVCQQVVTNDSGLMHIAAALDKPQVALFGSSSPDFTPPLSDKAKVLYLGISCSPCFKRECPLLHHNCLRHILPQDVLNHLS